jgi:aspartyl-tRNA(Asn)/glutamyl-tRNA(Gln) amidotransferase subunit A
LKKYFSYSEFRKDLDSGQVSCVQAVQYYLDNIEKNKHLNVFLEVWEKEALEKAVAADKKIKEGNAGCLAGMVMALKDNICYKNHKVSASSKILEGFESVYSSTVAERLEREGVIFIGRTNCDEFAMGASNENSAYGPVKNAADTSRVPGGSSGGSAVAVQADLCLAALGSDTGGSIRQPAAFTGTIGYKPSYGMVSRHGLIAYASSFDQIGPITRSVEDTQAIMRVISGPDEYDATLSRQAPPAFSFQENGPKKIAFLRDCIENEGLDKGISEKMKAYIRLLEDAGHTVEPVDFPYLDFLVPCYYVLTTAEASSNLSRYQGLQFGYRSSNATDLESTFKKSRSEGFGPEVKRRIMLGTFVLSEGYYDAYYTQAQKVRRFISEKSNEILKKHDFILLPTTPGIAFRFGEKSENPLAMYMADIFTVQANIAGLPAISFPGPGLVEEMPWGIQLMGGMMKDAELLSFAQELQNTGAYAL